MNLALDFRAADTVEQRFDDRVRQSGNHAGKSGTDDHADGQVHHIAAGNECLKLLEKFLHLHIPSFLHFSAHSV